MRAEEFCFRRSQKVSVPTVNSISNDKHAGTGERAEDRLQAGFASCRSLSR